MSKKALKHDEVGYWSEIKLDIVKKYASAYSTILAKQNFVKGYLLNWDVLKTAGEMKSIEVFYNFMIMDANMNVFMKDPSKVTPEQAAVVPGWSGATQSVEARHKAVPLNVRS